MKNTLSIAGIGLLGGLAIAGWMPRANVTPVEASAPLPVTMASNFQAPAPEFQTVANRRTYYNDSRVRRAPSQTAYRNEDYRYNGRRVREERSTGKSVAIVGGSAAAGAAIGGIAGGGKGAALGAVTGGTAGFIYDRLTKDKR